jgi:hypothetical protein
MATFLANGPHNQNPYSQTNNLTVNMHPASSKPRMVAAGSSKISVPMYDPKSIKPHKLQSKLHQLLLGHHTLIYILRYFKFGFSPLAKGKNLN